MNWKERELPAGQERAPAQLAGRPGCQVMIDYIKEQVGPGSEYVNDLVRVVFSDRGCYYEFRDLPEEFSGAVGSGFRHEFVGTNQGLQLVNQIHQIALGPESADTHELSLMVIYGWDGVFRPDDTFVYHWRSYGGEEEGPMMMGMFRPTVLPIFFKLKADSDLVEPIMGTRKGVLFFVANLTDQHLLVKIPHQGPGVTDLNEINGQRLVH
jgi:hypothetical protein